MTNNPNRYWVRRILIITSFENVVSFQGAKTGKDNGYTVLLDVESFDYKFFKEGSEGLKVALVHHLDMPIMRQTGFHISPGTENQIAITPTLLATTPVRVWYHEYHFFKP